MVKLMFTVRVTMKKREPTEVVLLLLCKSSNMIKQRMKENKLKLISDLI